MADSQSVSLNPTPVAPGTYHPIVNAAMPVGTPVCPLTTPGGEVQKARANAAGTSNVTGVLATPGSGAGDRAQARYTGPVTLETTEWDAVTGQTGGLTPQSIYYLDAANAGKLTVTKPVSTGSYDLKVGIALSSTTLLVQIGTATGPNS